MTNYEYVKKIVHDKEKFISWLTMMMASTKNDENFDAWAIYRDRVKLWVKDKWIDRETNHNEDLTLFDKITSSVESLADKFVYDYYIDDKWGDYYKSSLIEHDYWKRREDAVEETIKKLKEEYHD